MTSPPTLDPRRTDQLRTFLVTEAAASTPRPVLTPARRRLAVGVAAALVVAGGLVATQAVGGRAPAAVAVEVEDGWTTVRLVDIDADPDAVVAELREAGFAAERRAPGSNPAPEGATGFGLIQDPGTGGIVGLSFTLPADAVGPAPTVDPSAEAVPVLPDDLEAIGIRDEGPDGVSVRNGTDITFVVYAED